MASAASSRAGKGRRALPEVPYASVLGAGAIRSLLAGPNGDAVQNVLFVLRQAAHDPARAKAAPLPRRDGISFGKSSARSPSGGVSFIGLLGWRCVYARPRIETRVSTVNLTIPEIMDFPFGALTGGHEPLDP